MATAKSTKPAKIRTEPSPKEGSATAARAAAPTTAEQPVPFVLGHARARAAIGRALTSGSVHHAWIFHGEPGVGKMQVAQAFARIFVDPQATAAQMAELEPPVDTPAARMINAGTHADLHIIRKELASLSDNRELRERKQLNIPLDLLRERMLGGVDGEGRHHESAVFRTSTLGHGKAFLIDEAELLDADAQNAMLKTLEEPPPNTLIVLVTAREDRLLPTIRSRCQRIAFGPLDAAAMSAWWKRSGMEVPAEDRALLDEFADGAPGMALRAAKYGLAEWASELFPSLDAIEQGKFPAGVGERIAELVDALAASVVDEDEHASKDAANRLGTRLLARLLGLRLRRLLRTSGENAGALHRALAGSEIISEFEHNVRNNVNLKHAIGNLVAQWTERTAPSAA